MDCYSSLSGLVTYYPKIPIWYTLWLRILLSNATFQMLYYLKALMQNVELFGPAIKISEIFCRKP